MLPANRRQRSAVSSRLLSWPGCQAGTAGQASCPFRNGADQGSLRNCRRAVCNASVTAPNKIITLCLNKATAPRANIAMMTEISISIMATAIRSRRKLIERVSTNQPARMPHNERNIWKGADITVPISPLSATKLHDSIGSPRAIVSSVILFQKVRLFFEIVRHQKSTFPNDAAASAFCEAAIPSREFTHLVRL